MKKEKVAKEKAPKPLKISGGSPKEAAVGAEVKFKVKGAAPGDALTFEFEGGVTAEASSFEAGVATVVVPDGAQTGAVYVSAGDRRAEKGANLTIAESEGGAGVEGEEEVEVGFIGMDETVVGAVKFGKYKFYAFEMVADNRPYNVELNVAGGTAILVGNMASDTLPTRDGGQIISDEIEGGQPAVIQFNLNRTAKDTVVAIVGVYGAAEGSDDGVAFDLVIHELDPSVAESGVTSGPSFAGVSIIDISPQTAGPGDQIQISFQGALPDRDSLSFIFEGGDEVVAQSADLESNPQTAIVEVPEDAQTGAVIVVSGASESDPGPILIIGSAEEGAEDAIPGGCTGGAPKYNPPTVEVDKPDVLANGADMATFTATFLPITGAMPDGAFVEVQTDLGTVQAAGVAGSDIIQLPLDAQGQAQFQLVVTNLTPGVFGQSTANITVQGVVPNELTSGCEAFTEVTVTPLLPPGVPGQ